MLGRAHTNELGNLSHLTRRNRSASLCLFQKIAAVDQTSSEESGRFKSVVLLAGNKTLEPLLAFLVVQTDPVS